MLCFSWPGLAQEKEDIVMSVLSKSVVGKVFKFNLSNKMDYVNEVAITYLGEIETKNKEKYHLITWGRVWGPNHHTTGAILLYDYKKEYFGKYVLGSISDLPIKLVKNELFFYNTNKKDCDKSLVTKINFKEAPTDIFIKCDKDFGDFYEFSLDSLNNK